MTFVHLSTEAGHLLQSGFEGSFGLAGSLAKERRKAKRCSDRNANKKFDWLSALVSYQGLRQSHAVLKFFRYCGLIAYHDGRAIAR